MGRFWEAKIIDFRIFFDIFSKQNLKGILEDPKIEKKALKTKKIEIFDRPDGMCGARGRERGGIRTSRPRLLELSNLGLQIFVWPSL